MIRHLPSSLVIAILALLLLAPAAGAQQDPGESYRKGSGGGGSAGEQRFSISFGAGIVRIDDDADSEPYYAVGLRIPIGRGKRFRRFVEPEVGRWEFDQRFGRDDRLEVEMENAGVNLIAASGDGRRLQFFIGIGLASYRENVTIIAGSGAIARRSSTNFGGNVQGGVDFHLARHLAIFGQWRLDFVDSDTFDEQPKLGIGLRLKL